MTEPNIETRRMTNLGPLHDLMLRACPPDPTAKVKSIAVLGRAVGCTSAALYKAISQNRLTPDMASKIVRVYSEAREAAAEEAKAADNLLDLQVWPEITLDDFHSYVYG